MSFLEKEEQVDVLWLSDSPNMPTGFGVQTAHVCKGIAQAGIKIDCVGGQLMGMPIRTPILDVLPGSFMNVGYGANLMANHIRTYNPHTVVALVDLWNSAYLYSINRRLGKRYWSWIQWMTIDGYLAGEKWDKFYDHIDILVAMSKFGYNYLTTSKPEKSRTKITYIPHGVDTENYKYLSENERRNIKAKMGEHLKIPNLEDKFVVLSVGRNQMRKDFPTIMMAWKEIQRKYPDAYWIIHNDAYDPAGWNLDWALDQYNIKYNPSSKTGSVAFTNLMSNPFWGISSKDMCELYNVADVHLLPTKGEGFGVPIIESLASGIPNIVTDCTTSPEFLDPLNKVEDKIGLKETEFGWLVPHEGLEMMQGGVLRARISSQLNLEAIEEAINCPTTKLRTMGISASNYIRSIYSFANISKYWVELINGNDLEEREKSYMNWIDGVTYTKEYGQVRRFDAVAEYFRKECEIIEKHIPESAFVIDIGCGSGHLLKSLENGKRCLLGIDRSQEATLNCRSKGIFAVVGNPVDDGFAQVSADVVIAQHVVEHIEDYYTFIINMIKKSTCCSIIVLPNENMLDLTHKHRFNAEAVEELKEKILNDKTNLIGSKVEVIIENNLPTSFVLIIKKVL